MNSKRSSEVKVGFLVAIGLVILVALLVNSANWRRGIGGRSVRARFGSVSNLQLGAPVHMSGVSVGRVIDIKLRDDWVEVFMKVDIPRPLREGASVSIGYLGVVGETYVDLKNGPKGNPPLPEDAMIVGQDPASVAEIMVRAEKAVISLLEVADASMSTIRVLRSDLQKAADKINDRLDKSLSLVDETLTDVREVSSKLNDIVSQNSERLDAIVANIEQLTERGAGDYDEIKSEVVELIGQTRSGLDDFNAQLDRILLSTNEFLDSVDESSRSLSRDAGEFIGRLRDSSAEIKGSLAADLESLRVSLDRLREIEDQMVLATSKLNAVLERVDSGKGTLGKLMGSDDAIVQAQTLMGDLSQAARDTSKLLNNVSEKTAVIDRYSLGWEAGVGYNRQTETLTSRVGLRTPDFKVGISVTGDETDFDFQYVRQFGIGPSLFEGRVGAIHSRAGAGFDWWWLSHKLGVSLDLMESDGEYPRIDAYVKLRLFQRWHIAVGGENIADDPGLSAGFFRHFW